MDELKKEQLNSMNHRRNDDDDDNANDGRNKDGQHQTFRPAFRFECAP